MENNVVMQITHEVKNFNDWKQGFEADNANRVAMGVQIISLYTSVDNANLVTVTASVPSLEVAQGFMSNPDLKASMEKAGVISAPEIKLFHSKN